MSLTHNKLAAWFTLLWIPFSSANLAAQCTGGNLNAAFTGFQCHDFSSLAAGTIESSYRMRATLRDEDGSVLRDTIGPARESWPARFDNANDNLTATVEVGGLNFAQASGVIQSVPPNQMMPTGVAGTQLVTGGVGLVDGGSYVLSSAYAGQSASTSVGNTRDGSMRLLSKRISVALRLRNDGGPVRGNVRDPFLLELRDTVANDTQQVNLFETSLEVDSSALLDELLPGEFDFTITPSVEWTTGFSQGSPTLNVSINNLSDLARGVGIDGYWELRVGDAAVSSVPQLNAEGFLRFEIRNGEITNPLPGPLATGIFTNVQATGAMGNYDIDLSSAMTGLLDLDPMTGDGLVQLGFQTRGDDVVVSASHTIEAIQERYANPTGQMFTLNRADFPADTFIPIDTMLVGGAPVAGAPLASGAKFVIEAGGSNPQPPQLLRTVGSENFYDAELVLVQEESAAANQIYFNQDLEVDTSLNVTFDLEFRPTANLSTDQPSGLEMKLLPTELCGETGIPTNSDCLGWFAGHPNNVPVVGLRFDANRNEVMIMNANGADQHLLVPSSPLQGKHTAVFEVDGTLASLWLVDEGGTRELLAEDIELGSGFLGRSYRAAFSGAGGRHTAIDNFIMTSATVPEPATNFLCLAAILGLSCLRRRRRGA